MLISYELNIYSGFRFYSFKWCTFQLVWWCIFQLVYTHLNAHSFQFNRLNEKNRSDRRLVTDFLLEFFRDKMATSAQYGKAIHIMILNFCVSDLIFSYSFKALRSLSISENLLKNDYIRELKGSHRMMMVLYKKKFYSLILICNYIFRFIKRKNMGHGGL